MSPATETVKLLRTDDAAALIGLSRSTLEKLRVRGGGPPYIQIGTRAVAYRLDDLVAWVESRPRVTTTSEAAAQAASR